MITIDNILEIIKENKNIKNEIERTYLWAPIYRFIEFELDVIIIKSNTFDNIKNFIEDIENLNSDSYIMKTNPDNLEQIRKFLFNLNILMMDIYTLCRMFKLHENTISKIYIDNESERKEVEPTQPIENTNVIYYAGWRHTERIRKFLLSQRYKLIYAYDLDENNDCVKMNENIDDTVEPLSKKLRK